MSEGPSTASTGVVVPDLVGLPLERARDLADAAGVVLVQPDPDGPPLGALLWGTQAEVLTLEPPPGTVVPRSSSVVVTWRAAGSTVREPRRPAPDARGGAAARLPDRHR